MKDYVGDWDALGDRPRGRGRDRERVERERTTLRLIASENYASPAVLAAIGSTMNNKYAEGYPGRRYYGGCEFVDVTETARDRPREGSCSAPITPTCSRTPAPRRTWPSSARSWTRGTPTRRCSGWSLPHGGHLTHGSPVNVSGMWFNFVGYEVDRETEQLDMDRVRDLAIEHRPQIILAGYTAYPREIDFAAFRADRRRGRRAAVGRRVALHRAGRRRRVSRRRCRYADVVTFTTHKALRGPRGAMILCREEHAKAIDKAVFPMMQGGPLEHCIAGKAVALKEAMQPEFRDYAAPRRARRARAGRRRSPTRGCGSCPGGTDSHLILADVQPIGIDGKPTPRRCCDEVGHRAQQERRSRSTRNPPSAPSGIRVGTPGPATLGHGRGRDAGDRPGSSATS